MRPVTEYNRNLHTAKDCERKVQKWKINLLSPLSSPISTDHVQGINFLLFMNVNQPEPYMALGVTGRCLATLKHVTDRSKSKTVFENLK